jgi:chromatin remodeling complex protein RSC6
MPKAREKRASAGRANALQKPLQPSEELAAVVGSGPLPRGQVVSKIWEYIRSHNLQNPENRREILADDKLQRVFGKDKATMASDGCSGFLQSIRPACAGSFLPRFRHGSPPIAQYGASGRHDY